MMNKIERILRDQENIREQERQEGIKTKFVVSTPYPKNSNEYLNALHFLEAWCKTNELILKECEECEECGAVNDTVELTEVGNGMRYLCDHCHAQFANEV